MTIEYRTCLYCGKEWRTGTMDLNRYCSTGCWADALDEDKREKPEPDDLDVVEWLCIALACVAAVGLMLR